MSRLASGVVGAAALLTALTVAASTADAQSGSPTIELVDQTLVVGDDPAAFVVTVTDPPDDARLGVTIFADPASSRDEVRDRHESPPLSRPRLAAFECTLVGDCFGQALLTTDDDRVTVTLDDTVIGESLRRDEGALTVVVSLLEEDGTPLDEFVTSLLVLHETSTRQAHVGFVSSLVAAVAHGPDQTISIDAEPLLEQATRIPEGLPVTVDLRPETLTALDAEAPTASRQLLAAIDGQPLLRSPWVAMDEEAWRIAGEGDRVIAQYALGGEVVEAIAATSPSALVRLDPDATPGTLSLLRAAGANAVIADEPLLDATTRARPADQPVTVLDDNGVAMPVLRFDDALHRTLAGADPALAGRHAAIELLMAINDGEAADAIALLDLDRLDPAVLDVFLAMVDDRRELRIVDVIALADLDPQRIGGTPDRAELQPIAPPDVGELAAELRAATAAVATLAAMLEPETEALEPLSTRLRAAVSSDLTPDEAGAYPDAVFAEVVERTSGIEIPAGERITLTDRRTDLPLRIVNTQGVALNVELVLNAEKIRFPDGDRRSLRLQPGDNTVVIPVETLASGDARVTATVVSPGGGFELASGTVDIRSTALSGVGLAISVIALAILGAWWIRTIRRVRHNRAAATVAATSDGETDSPTGEPGEGES